jgi:hypothetical protein
LSIVIRESVDVDDVLLELLEDRLGDEDDVFLELLEDRLDDEDESPVVMNKDLPLKFALTSLNCILLDLLDSLSSFLEQEMMVKLRRDIRSMRKISFIFSSKLKVK